jgi:hypothetical protein
MGISFVAGRMLSSDLQRDSDLAFNTNLLYIDVTGNRIGINTISPTVELDVVGNIRANNFSAIGNITTGNITITANAVIGNVFTDGYYYANGNPVDFQQAAGSNSQLQYNLNDNFGASANLTFNANASVLTVNGNINTGNVIANTALISTGNITGGNLAISGAISGAGNIIASGSITSNTSFVTGNITIPVTGNITVGNVNINNVANPTANADAATKYYVDTQIVQNTNIANLTVSNTTISTNISNGNIYIAPPGSGEFQIVGTNGFVIPVGNTGQRPSPTPQGTMRFNSDTLRVEVYDGIEWDQIVGGVTNQAFNGDGTTTNFTLDRSTSTAAALVMLNGVVQRPGIAYNMSPNPGTNLVFTEAPAISDAIDIRFL